MEQSLPASQRRKCLSIKSYPNNFNGKLGSAKGSRNAKIKYNKKYLLEDNGAEKKNRFVGMSHQATINKVFN